MLVAWYDFGDISTLYQDVARTNPVTTDGQNIQAAADKTGNGFHMTNSVAGNSPLYAAQAGGTSFGAALFPGGVTFRWLEYVASPVICPGDVTVVSTIMASNLAAANTSVYGWSQRDPGVGTPIRGQFYFNADTVAGHFRNDASGLANPSLAIPVTGKFTVAAYRITGTVFDILDIDQNVNSTAISGTTTGITKSFIGNVGAGGTVPNGFVAETRVFNHALTSQELRGETTAMYSKWVSTRGQPTARPSLKRNR